jgi:hypothetical protein
MPINSAIRLKDAEFREKAILRPFRLPRPIPSNKRQQLWGSCPVEQK